MMVFLWLDRETFKVGRAHHAYTIDGASIRTLGNELLTPNTVLLQDLPSSALDKNGKLDANRI